MSQPTVRAVSAALALTLSACAALDEQEDVGAVQEPATTDNALTANALTANALTANALTANALTANALTANSLMSNSLTAAALTNDASARTVLKYVAGCALPAGAHFDLVINGATYGYDGAIGLAAAWGNAGGSCDNACKTWVSGCVISRLNYLGVPVPISIRGSKAQLSSTTTERQNYPNREATYYGNVFSSPQTILGCLSPGMTTDTRVCGDSIGTCAVHFVGSCDAACDAPKADGSFPNCRDQPRDPITNKFPAGTLAYPGSVTVFLQ
jgi:hypothetical protein